MKYRKQVMTAVYTIATLFPHFFNISVARFYTKAGIGWMNTLYEKHPFATLIYLPDGIFIVVIISLLLFYIYIFLIVRLMYVLEHRQIYFIWGIMLLFINVFSIFAVIAPMSIN